MDLWSFAREEATRQGVDPSLVESVMRQESGGRAGLTSPKGARGPMQLMPATAKELGVNPDDPQDNIRGGVRYLKQQIDTFGDTRQALAAYNAGPGNVRKHGGVPPFAETQNYVRNIMGEGQGWSADDIFNPTTATAAPRKNGGGWSADDVFSQGAQAMTLDMPDLGQPTPRPQYYRLEDIDPNPTSVIGKGLRGLDATVRGVATGAALGGANEFAAGMDTLFNQAGGLMTGGKREPFINEFTQRLSEQDARDRNDMEDMPLARMAGMIGGALATGGLSVPLAGGTRLVQALRGAGAGAATGGASGWLSTDGTVEDRVKGMTGGAVLGGTVGGGLAGMAGRKATDNVKTLMGEGVSMTPGMVGGPMAKRFEDTATSLPFIGPIVQGAKVRAVEDFSRAAINKALRPAGLTLPNSVKSGHDAITWADNAVSDAYTRVLPKLNIGLDQEFVDALRKISSEHDLVDEKAGQLTKQVKRLLEGFDESGAITGEAMKKSDARLGERGRELSRDGSIDNRDLGKAVRDVQRAMREMVARQNPDLAPTLNGINQAFAGMVRADDAAASLGAKEGVFTPAMLKAAARRGDNSGRKTAFRQGDALMQDFANAGADVLPSTVPDSGTAARVSTSNIGGLLVGAAALPAGLAYTRTGSKIITKAMTGDAGDASMAAGRALGAQQGQSNSKPITGVEMIEGAAPAVLDEGMVARLTSAGFDEADARGVAYALQQMPADQLYQEMAKRGVGEEMLSLIRGAVQPQPLIGLQ